MLAVWQTGLELGTGIVKNLAIPVPLSISRIDIVYRFRVSIRLLIDSLIGSHPVICSTNGFGCTNILDSTSTKSKLA